MPQNEDGFAYELQPLVQGWQFVNGPICFLYKWDILDQEAELQLQVLFQFRFPGISKLSSSLLLGHC